MIVLIRFIALLSVVALSTAAKGETISVNAFIDNGGSGLVERDYNIGNGVALLDRFRFRFRNGWRHPFGFPFPAHLIEELYLDDHHYGMMGARVIRNSKLQVRFQDRNTDDDFDYLVSHQIVRPPFSDQIIEATVTSERSCKGKCEVALTLPPSSISGHTFVLRGFNLFYTNAAGSAIENHHLLALGIREVGGKLEVELRDKNPDDNFGFVVDYAWVPNTKFLRIDWSNGGGGADEIQQIAQGESVIRGFKLRFNNFGDDQHVGWVEVNTDNDGNVSAYLTDKNESPAYRYTVYWAILAPTVVIEGGSGPIRPEITGTSIRPDPIYSQHSHENNKELH